MLRRPVRLLALFVPLMVPLLGVGSCERRIIEIGLPGSDGALPIEIALPVATRSRRRDGQLDGIDVTPRSRPAARVSSGSLPIPAPGSHRAPRVAPVPDRARHRDHAHQRPPLRRPRVRADAARRWSRRRATTVPRSAWLRFRLAAPVPPAAALDGFGFAIECDGNRVARAPTRSRTAR